MADGSVILETKIDDSGAKKGIGNLRSEAAKLAAEYKKSGMDSSTAWKKAWSEIERESKTGSNKIKNDFESISSIAKKCLSVIGGLFLLDKVKDYSTAIVKTGIAYNAMKEQSQVAWSTILGSSTKASKMMKEIEQYAAKTPFSKMGVDQMAKQLSNAGFKGQALFDQLTKFGNMGSAFGIQEDGLKEMVRQYSQVQQAGVAYTEDLNILQDRGIPIYKALGDVMGIPVSQVRKLASQGQVTADVYNKAIDSMSNKTKGAMEEQSKTFNGMVSTLKDNLSILAGKLAEPMFDRMKSNLQELMPKLENFTKLVGQGGIANAISQTFPQLKPLVDLLSDLGSTLNATIIPALTSFGGWILENLGPITFLASTIGGVVLAFKAMSIISGIIAFVQGLMAVFGLLEAATLGETAAQWAANLAFLACPLTWIVIAIGALVGAFIYLWTTSEDFRNFWIGLWESVKTFFINCWNGLINFFTETIPNAFNNIKSSISQFASDTIITFQNWGTNIWNFFTTTIPNWITSIGNWFAEIPGKIGSALGSAIGSIADWITNIGNWFAEIPGKIGSALSMALTTIVDWGIGVWNYFVVNIPIWINNIGTWFSQLPNKIGYALGFVLTKIAMWGVGVWNYFITNIPIWINSIGMWFSQLPGRIWTWLVVTVNKISAWGTKMYWYAVTVASNFVSKVINYICQLPGRIWTWLVVTVDKIRSWGSQMWSKASSIASQFVSRVVNYICQLPGRIWTWLCNVVSKVSAWGSQMWSRASSIASQFVSRVVNYICQLPGRIWTWLCNAASRVSEWGGSLFSRGVEAASQLVNAVVDTVSSIPGKMLDIGKNIVEGIWNGITGMGSWLMDNVNGFFSGFVDGVKDALDIHSPSRKMEKEIGIWLLPGVEVGVDKTMPDLIKNLKDKMKFLTKTMQAKVMAETNIVGASVVSKSNFELNSKIPEYVTTNNDNGITQNIVFNEPVESPSDVARKVKQIGRDIVFG